MTIAENIVPSPNDVGNLLGITQLFNINSDPYNGKLTMLYKQVGQMRDMFIKGPCRSVKTILTMDDSWKAPFSNVKKRLVDSGVYAFLTVMEGEGTTIWGLIPDDSFFKSGENYNYSYNNYYIKEEEDNNSEENSNEEETTSDSENNSGLGKLQRFNDTIKSDIKGRRWMTAFNTAQKKMPVGDDGRRGAPFAVAFIASYTENSIPFFGRVAWGVAVKNDVISLTQIPLMVQGNKEQYFVWSFVPKMPITDQQLTNKYGKGGGESSYSKFKDLRKFLQSECEPLNERGEYSFAKGGGKEAESPDEGEERPDSNVNTKESNPLIHAAKNNQNIKDSFLYSVKESIEVAQSFLIDEAYRIYEASRFYDDDTEDDVGTDRSTYPSGYPYLNKIKKSGFRDVPLLGPLY